MKTTPGLRSEWAAASPHHAARAASGCCNVTTFPLSGLEAEFSLPHRIVASCFCAINLFKKEHEIFFFFFALIIRRCGLLLNKLI